MIHLTPGALGLAVAFSLSLQSFVPAQSVAWEMDMKGPKQRQVGEIRTRSEPRLNTHATRVNRGSNQPAFSINRPSVIEIGPLRNPRTPASPPVPQKR